MSIHDKIIVSVFRLYGHPPCCPSTQLSYATDSITAKETYVSFSPQARDTAVLPVILVVYTLFSGFLRKGSDQEYSSFRVCGGRYNSSFQ